MSDFDHGDADEFEVIWKSGHVDRFQAHQVTRTGGDLPDFLPFRKPERPERVHFHGWFDGHWRLVLDAPADDLATIRNLTRMGDPFGGQA